MNELRISDRLSLPLDFVTARVSLVGMSGAGKSNAFADMIEEVEKARGLFVLVDPLGAAWGMRSNAAGDGPGLPVPIFGGYHADVSITPTSGKLVARELYEADANGIVDLSAFDPDEASAFYIDLIDGFMRLHQRQKKPRSVFVDEASIMMPERCVSKLDYTAVAASFRIHSGGRALGLGLKTATQSAAEQAKRTMKQSEMFVALRTFAPIDQKPILDYLRTSVDADRATEIKKTLAKLKDGEAWFIAPHWLGIVERARFRLRETFDSSRTPKVGETIAEPKVLAAVDLARISAAIAATEEPAADEVSKLRNSETVAPVEDLAIIQAEVVELETRVTNLMWQRDRAVNVSKALYKALKAVKDRAEEAAVIAIAALKSAEEERASDPKPLERRAEKPAPTPGRAVRPSERETPRSSPAEGSNEPGKIKAGARRMLEQLARCGGSLSKTQLAVLAGVNRGSGTFYDYLSALRIAGYIEDDDRTATITKIGAGFIGERVRTDPPTTADIVAIYMPKLKSGARRMLELLLKAHPRSLTKIELSEQSGVNRNSGTFFDYLSALRRLGLIEDDTRTVCAASTLYPTGKSR